MTQATRGRMNALIVEDDGGVSELGAVMLEEFDLSVARVANAEDAIEHLQQCCGDVAVMVADVHLPGQMDGMSLARSVSVLWPAVSVIVTSGHPGNRLVDLPDRAVFVPKPWRALDIVSAAEKAARADHSVHAIQF
jgi:DNA-binding NtrC family response regulator